MPKGPRMNEAMAAQLMGYVARIVKLTTEMSEAKSEISRLYAEARACGFNNFALRRAVERRVLQREAARSRAKVGKGLTAEGNDADAMYEAILEMMEKRQ